MMLLRRHSLLLSPALLVTIVLESIVSASESFTPAASVINMMMVAPTPVSDVNSSVNKVAAKADEWKALALDNKIDLLQQVLDNCIQFKDEWVNAGLECRGIHPTDVRQGCARADVWTAGPATFGSYANGLLTSLQHCLRHDGMPPPPRATRVVHDKTVVTLWPASLLDKLEAVGVKGELVVGDTRAKQDNINQACIGGVAGILGAGNFNAPIEMLCELFLKGRVCLYKANPVNQGQCRVLMKIFEPLVQEGYVYFLVGGADVGTALVQHDLLDEIVLTGSKATHETIQALSDIPICAELGGVNPWIIVPSKHWNRRSINRHARHLAFCKLANNGHTCAAPQVVIVSKNWPLRSQFLIRLRYWLGKYAGNAPFYPNSAEIYSHFAKMANVEIITSGNDVFDKQQCPILITNVSVEEEEHKDVFVREAFCPVLAEVPIDCAVDVNTLTFLQTATQLAQDHCFGSLTINIVIPDADVKKIQNDFDRLVVELPFGIVGVNLWPAFGHSMPMLVWGAPSGHTQSGVGFLGNASLYQNPCKTILRAPFDWMGIRALSISSPRKTEKMFRRLATYKLKPNVVTQSMLFAAVFLGI